jgi:hypothetical protein
MPLWRIKTPEPQQLLFDNHGARDTKTRGPLLRRTGDLWEFPEGAREHLGLAGPGRRDTPHVRFQGSNHSICCFVVG